MNNNQVVHKNINQNIDVTKKESKWEKLRDYFTKGFHIHIDYEQDWDIIKEISYKYNADMAHLGPAITIQLRNTVQLIDGMVQELKTHKRIRELLSFGLSTDQKDLEAQIQSRLFVTLLCSLPTFCVEKSGKEFHKFICNDKNEKFLIDLINVRGTIKKTDVQIRGITNEIIVAMKR